MDPKILANFDKEGNLLLSFGFPNYSKKHLKSNLIKLPQVTKAQAKSKLMAKCQTKRKVMHEG